MDIDCDATDSRCTHYRFTAPNLFLREPLTAQSSRPKALQTSPRTEQELLQNLRALIPIDDPCGLFWYLRDYQ